MAKEDMQAIDDLVCAAPPQSGGGGQGATASV